MEIAKIEVTRADARKVHCDTLTAGMKGAEVSFSFDASWDGLNRIAIFKAGGVSKDMLLTEDRCEIPHEVLERPVHLVVGVYGTTADGHVVIPTVWAELGRVEQGARPSGDNSKKPTPEVWAQILGMIGDLDDLNTDEKETLVAAINEVLLKGADPEEVERIVDEYLKEHGTGGTVKTVNGVSPDENGNVEVAIPEISVARFDNGDESGVTIYVDTKNADGDIISQSATVYDGKDGGGTVEVDTTLSESGKAADAKAVGDALANKQPKGDYVKTVNGTVPDENGNVNFSITAPDGSVVVDPTLTQGGVAADAAVVGQHFKGLTEELHDDVMVPYDWTQYTLRNVDSYTAYTVYVPNNAVAAYDGRAYKLSFSGGGDKSMSTLATGEMVTLFHFRHTDGTYTEIGRYKFPACPYVVNEYDLDFEVKAGDIFGINSIIGQAAVNLGNKEYTTVYGDDAISFTQADLDSGSNLYCARLFTVYISGTRDTAGKAQLAAEYGSMSVLRKADIETTPLKNLFNPTILFNVSLNDNGTVSNTNQAKATVIKVEPNTAYSYNRRDASKWITTNNAYCNVFFYDENMVFLSSVKEDALPFTPEMGKTLVTPDNCAYVAIQTLPYGQPAEFDVTDILQFERGTHNTQYEPYGRYVSAIKGIPLFRYIPKEVQEYDAPINLVVMGDSISSTSLGLWFDPMIQKYNFKSARNIGIGGACWTHYTDTAESVTDVHGGHNNVLTNQVNILIDGVTNQGWTKPDVVFIYCGINDRGMALDGETGLNYGDPEAAFEYTDDYSNLSYTDPKLQNLCGAFRFAMEKLYRAFPYVKVVVCTPMYTGNNSNKKVRALNKTIKECASWMGIPVFDLTYESYVYQKFEEGEGNRKYLGDTLHPNETGGKLLADLIAHHLIARFGGKEFYDLSG